MSILKYTFFCICILMPCVAQAYTTGCSPISGGTCYQADATQADIGDAIAAATAGDTIRISAGTATFSSMITVDKALYIIGNGIGSTIIFDDYTTGTFELSGSGFIRLAYFTLSGTHNTYQGSIKISGNSKRLDHISFESTNDRHPVCAFGNLSDVVIDNCIFASSCRGINIYGNVGYWTDSAQFALGTSYGIYIEDCTFNLSGAEVIDIQTGGAYIARYNSVPNGGNFAVHGADSGARSGGYVEIYNNSFTWTGGGNKDFAVVMRGGAGVFYNNTVTGSFNNFVKLVYYRSCYPVDGLFYHVDNQNRCEHESVNPLDGDETPPANGYPCKDQPGRGPNQSQQPMYEWSNTYNSADIDFSVVDLGSCGNTLLHIVENRDYYNDTSHPTYTPYTYPHPLRGTGRTVSAGQGTTISVGTGSTVTWGN